MKRNSHYISRINGKIVFLPICVQGKFFLNVIKSFLTPSLKYERYSLPCIVVVGNDGSGKTSICEKYFISN